MELTRANELGAELSHRSTMASIRSLATATEAFAVDDSDYKYPDVDDIEQLRRAIEPVYIRQTPTIDQWGDPFHYVVSDDREAYRFVSAGRMGCSDATRSRSVRESMRRVTI